MTVRTLADLRRRFRRGKEYDGQDARDLLASVYPDGGAGAVGLLAVAQYLPASVETKSTTSTTPTDADASNMLVTFTVPPSGEVLIRLTANGRNTSTTGSHEAYWSVIEGSTMIAEGFVAQANGNIGNGPAVALYVTGLTAGDSKTYKWGHRVKGGGTSSIFVGESSATPNYEIPAIMEVWAVS